MKRIGALMLVAILALSFVGAEDGGFNFQAGIVLGTDVIAVPGSTTGETQTWNRLASSPT